MNTLSTEQKWSLICNLSSARASDVDLEEAGVLLVELAHDLLSLRMHISMNGVQGAPDWKGYETDLWRLSEELREFFRNNRKLRGKNAFLDAIVRIASDSRFGKGRQNFVLILGEFGKGEYGDVLGKLLSDVDVYGHALKGLIRGKTLGYERSVAAILEKEKLGWIRSAAKKYLGLSNE